MREYFSNFPEIYHVGNKKGFPLERWPLLTKFAKSSILPLGICDFHQQRAQRVAFLLKNGPQIFSDNQNPKTNGEMATESGTSLFKKN